MPKSKLTDITYIRTWQGRLYLTVVMDLFSRKIVGWATGPTIHRELVVNGRPDGHTPTASPRQYDSFGSGHAVRLRRVAAILPLESPGAEYEPQRQLLGQCRGRELLRELQKRARAQASIPI